MRTKSGEKGAEMKVGILGFGKMGAALFSGLSGSTVYAVCSASTRSEESARKVREEFGLPCSTEANEVLKQADLVVLAVKPHQAESLLKSLQGKWKKDQILISVCAALTTSQLEEWTQNQVRVVRSMPNTPCLIGQGMTVLCSGKGVSRAQLEKAEGVFSALGRTTLVEESLMDGVTGLSGCGPAYVYLMIEALSEAGVKVGLSREVSTLLAAQTLKGAADMVLARGVHPASLKDEVTTPAGCTIDGLMALEEGKLRVTLIKAVLAATQRSKKLGKKA